MRIRYQITPQDIINVTAELHKETDPYKAYVLMISVMGILFMMSDMFLLVVFVFLNDPSFAVPDIGPSLFIKILLWLVIIGITFSIAKLSGYRAIKKALDEPGINGVFCEHHIEIDEAGFTETTEVNRGYHSWTGVEHVRETAGYVLIQIRLGAVYFIPRSAFSSDMEREQFVSTVSEYINRASVPLPPSFDS